MNSQQQSRRIEEALASLQAELNVRSREAGELEAQAAEARADCQRVKKAIAALSRGTASVGRQTLTSEDVRGVVESELARLPSGSVEVMALRGVLKRLAKERGCSARGAHRVLVRVLSDLGLEEREGRVQAVKPLASGGRGEVHDEVTG